MRAGNDDFSFTDTSDTPQNGRLNVIITTAPISGTLKNAGTAITSFPATLNIGDFAANNITFTPLANLNSTATPTFNLVFKVQDDGGTAFGPDANGPDIDTDAIARTLTFSVAAKNDAPIGTNNAFTINEDGAKTLAAGDFGFTDPSDALSGGGPLNSLQNVIITSIGANGTLFNGGVAVAPGTPIPAANFGANQVVFKPNANFNGNTSFTFKVQDNGGTANSGVDTDTADRTISFTVNAISDEPVGQDKTINSTFNTNAAGRRHVHVHGRRLRLQRSERFAARHVHQRNRQSAVSRHAALGRRGDHGANARSGDEH